MVKYVLRRFIISIVVLFTVLFIAYALVYNLPENYAEIVAREMSFLSGSLRSAEEWEEILISEYGLDCGLIKGFFLWISNSLRGNFGTSWYYGIKVTQKFYPAFVNSLIIGIVAAIGAFAVSLPLGLYSASGKNRKVGNIISLVSVVMLSVPAFFIVALLKYIFSVKLGWFDLGGLKSFDSVGMNSLEVIVDRLSHMVLPVAAMIIASTGTLVRYVHVNVNLLKNARYIKGLRAKGVADKRIVFNHILRNSAVPIINVFCVMIPTALSGSIIIETLFSIDGIGFVAYNALIYGDIPMIMFYILHTTFLTVGFSFISDVLCAVVDYRVAGNLMGGGNI